MHQKSREAVFLERQRRGGYCIQVKRQIDPVAGNDVQVDHVIENLASAAKMQSVFLVEMVQES
jgi:hypothetical protein